MAPRAVQTNQCPASVRELRKLAHNHPAAAAAAAASAAELMEGSGKLTTPPPPLQLVILSGRVNIVDTIVVRSFVRLSTVDCRLKGASATCNNFSQAGETKMMLTAPKRPNRLCRQSNNSIKEEAEEEGEAEVHEAYYQAVNQLNRHQDGQAPQFDKAAAAAVCKCKCKRKCKTIHNSGKLKQVNLSAAAATAMPASTIDSTFGSLLSHHHHHHHHHSNRIMMSSNHKKRPPLLARMSFPIILLLLLVLTEEASSSLGQTLEQQAATNHTSARLVRKLRNAPPTDSDAANQQQQQQQPQLQQSPLLPHYEPLQFGSGGSSLESTGQLQEAAAAAAASVGSSKPATKSKRTLYACEEKQLQIECQRGEYIEVVRANYGRFSIGICNEHGQLDWKVNCMQPTSQPIVQDSCQSKQSCQLLASNAIFGDACPGTQKYLEVHYQCKQLGGGGGGGGGSSGIAANATAPPTTASATLATSAAPLQQDGQHGGGRTGPALAAAAAAAAAAKPNNNNNNVILPQQQQQQPTNEASDIRSAGARPAGPQWFANSTPPPLPDWMPSVSPQSAPAPQLPVSANHHQQARWNQQPGSGGSVAGHCPELVWRQVRWPQTEPGLLAQMPCPAHAHSLEPYAASLACLAGGHWARRVQANRCQSLWLRNLTQRLEAGDSALSVAAELVQRTRQPAAAAAAAAASQLMSGPNGGLFGQDLAAIGRAVQRIVASTAELLIRIQDDKQRVAFAREIVQSLVELINNLALETHLDAWLDLDAQPGERQRISGQLVQSLESASVLLASTLSQPANEPQQQPQQADSFVKTSESAYVTVRTLNLAAGGQLNSSYSSSSSSSADGRAREIEVAFPNEASLLGTKWMNSMPQKFTLHLQTSLASGGGGTELTTPADPFQAGNQNLKIVFVMLKGIGAQMEQQQQQQPAPQVELPDSAAAAAQPSSSSRLVVNSNLVSLSIVADQRYTIKVDLSAPIELVFKHLELVKSMKSAPHCVYWDTTISDWLSDGCKLIDSNRTHSTCACSHLTTFALLTSSDDLMLPTRHHHQQQQQQQQPQLPPLLHHDQPQQPSLNHYQQQQQQPALLTKVQLDSVENELILPAFAQSGESSQLPTQQQQQQPASKLLYLIKMLNGHLFDSPATYGNGNNNNTANNPAAILNPRLLVYISCLVSALLLALHLVAVAYNRAHTRRLLGSMPAEPPPPLLVTNGQQQPPLRLASNSSRYQQQQHHGGSSLETTPTYGSAIETSATASDYLASAAAATAIKPQPSYFDLQPVSFKRQFQVPTHILIQLLLLQVLLILLVESQNYIHQMRLDSFHSIQSLNDNNYGGPMMTMMMIVAMNPIGPITWFLVGLLYYLIGCLTFWLASQLIKLDLNLAGLASFAAAPVGPSETGAGWCSSSQSKPPVQSIFAPASISSTQSRDSPTDSTDGVKYGPPSTIYGGPPQRTTLNLYGGAPPASVCYGTGFGAGINNPLQQATATAAGGNNVTSDCSPGSSFSAGSALGNTKRPLSALLSHLLNPAIGRPLHLVLVHLCPVLCVSAIVWLSSPRVSWFNSLTFTSSFGFQLVYWPLLIDLTSSALSILLYYIPAVCLVLFCVAVFLLRACSKRQQRQQLFAGFVSHSEDLISSEAPNSNGHADDGPLNSMMTTIHHHHRQLPPTSGGGGGGDSSSMRKSTPAASVNPYGSSALVQQACSMTSSSSAANPREPQSIPLAAALNKQHQQQQRRQQSRKAAYCTSDNRCALQRWQANDLKKAKFVCAILAALLALHSICWISFFAYLHEALNSPPPSAGSSSPSSGGGQHLMYAFASSNLALVLLIGWSQRRTLRRSAQLTGLTRLLGGLAALFGCSAGDRSMAAARRRARLYQRAQRAQTGSQTLAGKPGPAGGIKVSPSNQSLFLVSSQRPPAAHLAGSNYQQPAAYGSAGAAAYSSSSAAQQQQQQHLYQQLSDQQQQQHIYDSTSALNAGPAEQLNVMQLMHQQQQQVHRQQQQQHEQFATMHSHQPRNHPFHLQQQQHARHPMTLRPMGFERQQVDLSVAHMNPLMLDQVCQRQQQQQQQQTGEADGPLVAFSSCSSSSDSSGQPAQPVASSHQQQQQQATFGPIATPISQQQHSRQPRSGPQLFDQQQQQQQHQYYSINSPQGGRPAQQPHHFRRADSRQSRQRAANCLDASQSNVIDCVGEAPNSISGRGQPMGATDSKGNNIYDVANYALNQ